MTTSLKMTIWKCCLTCSRHFKDVTILRCIPLKVNIISGCRQPEITTIGVSTSYVDMRKCYAVYHGTSKTPYQTLIISGWLQERIVRGRNSGYHAIAVWWKGNQNFPEATLQPNHYANLFRGERQETMTSQSVSINYVVSTGSDKFLLNDCVKNSVTSCF